MSLLAFLKGRKALSLQSKGDTEGALKAYEEAVAKGLSDPRMLLAYAVLLIRAEKYQEAKELLVKIQKLPGITVEHKNQVFVDYAVCCYKLGNIDKGLDLLERQHLRTPSGLVYETLGYLYIEKCAMAQAGNDAPPPTVTESMPEEGTAAAGAAQAPSLLEKAEAFLKEAAEYDDGDAILLDNMGQFLYRIKGDKEGAKTWFEQALRIKDTQIDTLWFLSRYDLEEGNTKQAAERLALAATGRFSPLNFVTKAQVEAELAKLPQEG